MTTPTAIRARLVTGSPDFLPAVESGASPVVVELETDAALAENARFVIAARELFSGEQFQIDADAAHASSTGQGTWRLTLMPDLMRLAPGCWHLLVDAAVHGEPLAGPRAGSVAVYALRRGESLAHARASFNLARAEFAWDRRDLVYFKFYQSQLPPSGDPFSDEVEAEFLEQFIIEEVTAPELQHDGGLGYLFGAHVYHALGWPKRARHCEKVLRRTVHTITEQMMDDEGGLHYIQGRAEGRKQGIRSRQQAGFALKFLAQVYFYFAKGAGEDAACAREVLDKARRVFDDLMAHGTGVDCSDYRCKVYDGRILAGVSWYALAYRDAKGSWPTGETAGTLVQSAVAFSEHVFANDGWYDQGCLQENEIHGWCGNMNTLNGLLPALRVAQQDEAEPGQRATIERGIHEAFRFLVRSSGVVMDRPAFVPTMTSQWAAGNLYEIADEYLRVFGENGAESLGVRRLRDHLLLGAGAGIIDCFHRNNTSAAVLYSCPEYEALDPKPPLPWGP